VIRKIGSGVMPLPHRSALKNAISIENRAALHAPNTRTKLLLWTIRQIARRLGRSEAATYKAVEDARLRLYKCIDTELRKEQVR
jgi:hypothetical protein